MIFCIWCDLVMIDLANLFVYIVCAAQTFHGAYIPQRVQQSNDNRARALKFVDHDARNCLTFTIKMYRYASENMLHELISVREGRFLNSHDDVNKVIIYFFNCNTIYSFINLFTSLFTLLWKYQRFFSSNKRSPIFFDPQTFNLMLSLHT